MGPGAPPDADSRGAVAALVLATLLAVGVAVVVMKSKGVRNELVALFSWGVYVTLGGTVLLLREFLGDAGGRLVFGSLFVGLPGFLVSLFRVLRRPEPAAPDGLH